MCDLNRAHAMLAGFGILLASSASAEPVTKAPNSGGVINTRHNMTQSYLGAGASWMNMSRNDYGEVCVYCHTPHGANANVQLPLWNRTIKSTTYTTYDQLNTTTLTQAVTQPGANSLSCLSCHDGQVAVDSIINMPGSGRYQASQATSQDSAFLDAWPGGPGSSVYGGHGTLEVSAAAFSRYGECQSCHSIAGDQHDPGTMPAFDVFYIGTDLRNDHPVGITFPTTNPDFSPSTSVRGDLRYFDLNTDNTPDSNEIRLYRSGGAYKVECASCHDPHGVPASGPGSVIAPTFLRIPNTNSAVCLTCHVK